MVRTEEQTRERATAREEEQDTMSALGARRDTATGVMMTPICAGVDAPGGNRDHYGHGCEA